MRVLIASDTQSTSPTNPFVIQLVRAISEVEGGGYVTYGIAPLYWRVPFDIVHLHWPEALFGWKLPTAAQLKSLATCIDKRRETSSIVLTVHNLDPSPQLGAMGEVLFDLVYSRVDQFIHLSQEARDTFLSKYAMKPWSAAAKHTIIPHGDYSYYDRLEGDDTLVKAARKGEQNAPLIVVFGALRSAEEEALARTAFRMAETKRARMVFAGLPSSSTLPPGTVAEWKSLDENDIVRFHKRIPDGQVAPLIKAAKFLLVTRQGRLNSGVIPLAYTFGVPVIAPRGETVSPAVEAVGGPMYEPGDVQSAADAITAALAMDKSAYTKLRRRVEAYRAAHMDWPTIGRSHVDIYRQLRALPRERADRSTLNPTVHGRDWERQATRAVVLAAPAQLASGARKFLRRVKRRTLRAIGK